MAVNKIKSFRINEVLQKVEDAKSKSVKIQILQDYNTLALRNILKGAFDDSVEFMLPEGKPPFREANQNTPPSNLNRQSPRLKYFVIGGPGERLPKMKIEVMFIRLLEAVPPSESEIVLLMKDKKLQEKYPSLNKKLVQEAFPNLIAK